MKSIVFAGGGTMGHISPNIAIIEKIGDKFDKIYYIGRKNGLEKDKIEKIENVEYYGIDCVKFVRKSIFKNILLPFRLNKSIKDAKKILVKLKPDVIFSKGGYVALPVVVAGKKLGIPIVAHESDLSVGLANKISVKYANVLCTTFFETAEEFDNAVYTGSPVSKKILLADKNNAIKQFNLKNSPKIITIVGGSLGATAINNAVKEILPLLVNKYQIVHITGKGKIVNFSHPNYHQIEYSDDIGSIFKASDVVVSRAGSNTIFELATLKVPMILVPLSKKASRGDQIENANYFERLGISVTVNENELDKLKQTIDFVADNRNSFIKNLNKFNFCDGNNKIVAEIMKSIK